MGEANFYYFTCLKFHPTKEPSHSESVLLLD